jgi:TolA-binding protein
MALAGVFLIAALLCTDQLAAQEDTSETSAETADVASGDAGDDRADPVGGETPEGEGDGIDTGKVGEQMPSEEEKDEVPDAPTEAPEDADPEFVEELSNYQRAFINYSREIKDYQETVDSIVDAEYRRRQAEINERYNVQINRLEVVERRRRLDAIAAFEEFIERHPNHPKHTPDALFRLAELYFEKANDDFLRADEAFQEKMAQYRAGRIADRPPEPTRDYTKTIEIFERLVRDWPKYRLIDGAIYLLAYCYLRQGSPEEAIRLYTVLIDEHPDSDFIPEAHMRIGEYNFELNNLDRALAAYTEASKYRESRFYDKALYKVAWTHYRKDNFDEAIRRFKELIEYSDEQRERTGRAGSVLRAEAVEYMAISLSEDDWNQDGITDDKFVLPRLKTYIKGEKKYEREVLATLGEKLMKLKAYEPQVSVLRYALQLFPMNRENPKLHEMIILGLERDRLRNEAFVERERLADYYGEGSEWFNYQKKVGNEEAIRYAEALVRENLIGSATWYHDQAQELYRDARAREDDSLMAQAREKYRKAGQGYAQFLKKYPNAKKAYEWNFYYAECLYYSGQYYPAYEQYRVVREMDVRDNKYQEDSGYFAIKALEFAIADKVDSGELSSKALASASEAADRLREKQKKRAESEEEAEKTPLDAEQEQVTIEPIELPEMVQRYVTAQDRYVVLGLENEQDKYLDGKLAFRSAQVLYNFNHFDEARERFEWVIENFKKTRLAYLAGSLILETYRREKKYDKLALWADKLSDVIEGEQADQIRAEVKRFKLGAMFKSAQKLDKEGKHLEAAREYERVVKEDPDNPIAPKALNNAAVAYEQAERYEKAMELYERIYTKHRDSELACYALYRVAVNSGRFFEFEKASRTYMAFHDSCTGEPPEIVSKGLDFQYSEKRQDALRRAGLLEENLQNYEEAARLYEQYVRNYSKADDASEVLWRAQDSWRKADEKRKMVEAIEKYLDSYGDEADNVEKAFEGMMIIAEYNADRGRESRAKKWYGKILDAYESRKVEPGSEAAWYAAKAQFLLTEEKFDEWDKIKFTTRRRQQERALKKKQEGHAELTEEYKKVWGYGSLEWTLAATYRLGKLYQSFANMLYNAPIPFEPGTEGYDMYRTRLDDIAIPLEDEAIKFYEKTIKKARDEKIVNKWTKRTLEELAKYKPEEYPLYKEERRAIERQDITGLPPLDAKRYKKMVDPPDTKSDEDS